MKKNYKVGRTLKNFNFSKIFSFISVVSFFFVVVFVAFLGREGGSGVGCVKSMILYQNLIGDS